MGFKAIWIIAASILILVSKMTPLSEQELVVKGLVGNGYLSLTPQCKVGSSHGNNYMVIPSMDIYLVMGVKEVSHIRCLIDTPI